MPYFWPSIVLSRGLFFEFSAPVLSLSNHFISEVILVDVTHVLHRFTPNLYRGDDFHIVDPQVRIVATLRSLLAQFLDLRRTRIVGGDGEESLGNVIHRLFGVILLNHVAHVFGSGFDIVVELLHTHDANRVVRSSRRLDLHYSDSTGPAFEV